MAMSDKDIGSIMSKLMARQKEIEEERKSGNVTPDRQTNDGAAAVPPADSRDSGDGDGSAAPIEDGKYETILDDVMSFDQYEDYRVDGDSQSKLNDLYTEYIRAEGAKDSLPEGTSESVAPVNDARTEKEPEAAQDDDDLLMAALGYSGAEKNEKPEPRQKRKSGRREYVSDLAGAFAYNGHEYRSGSSRGDVLRAYDREQRMMYVRIAGTALFSILILLFELLGSRFSGPLDRVGFPVVHVMISLQLLVLCAAFSWRRIASGLIGIGRGVPVASSFAAVSVVLTVLYDLVVCTGITGGAEFSLYNFPAALSLLVLVGADQLKLTDETRNFTRLSSFDSVCTLEKDPSSSGRSYRLRRGRFLADYFRRTYRRSGIWRTANYVIAPTVAISIILFIVSLASKRGFVPSLNTFIVSLQMALPVYSAIALDLPFRILSLGRLDQHSVILSEADTEEFARVDRIILDETDLFSEDALKIVKVQQCASNVDIFEVMAVTGAVCDLVGGTVSRAFSSISGAGSETDISDVRIVRAVEGGIEAVVGGRQYLFGNMRFLGEYGVACRGCNDNEYASSTRGGTVFHIAVDRSEVFRYYMQYIPDPTFIELVGSLSKRGIAIELRCKDPNLGSEFVASMIGDETLTIDVVRDAGAESDRPADGIIEGGLVADGAEWMSVIRAAESCQLYRAVSRLNGIILIALYGAAALASVILGVLGTFTGLSPVYVVLVQILALIPSVIVSRLLIS